MSNDCQFQTRDQGSHPTRSQCYFLSTPRLFTQPLIVRNVLVVLALPCPSYLDLHISLVFMEVCLSKKNIN